MLLSKAIRDALDSGLYVAWTGEDDGGDRSNYMCLVIREMLNSWSPEGLCADFSRQIVERINQDYRQLPGMEDGSVYTLSAYLNEQLRQEVWFEGIINTEKKSDIMRERALQYWRDYVSELEEQGQ